MKYRNLGNSGLKVSTIGLGTNQFGGKVDLETGKDIIAAALDAGINFIDTADVYQKGRSEEFIGQAIAGRPRDQVLIATKVRHPTGDGPNDVGMSRHHILTGVEASLKRLGTDFIDIYQVHRWDPADPIEETMRALDDLVRSGKVRYLGASNFSAWQLTHANAIAEHKGWDRFVSIQPHYHMFERGIETELLPACEYFGIGVLPYFPLAGGFLSGKYKRGESAPAGSRGETSPYVQKYMTEENYDRLEKLAAFAEARGRTMNDLAHAWLLSRPAVSCVISGATKVEYVEANAGAGDWELSGEEAEEVEGVLSERANGRMGE
ncbi:MAG TPA: aldo/keto reductase [Anaerolineales bacterium]|nr:aldo/keto reductase [Anaerolineales bacterium]